ncbi:acylphosphatase-2 isoform X1 [Drosophila sechellia]|uniref:acylphosphatase-2 isoform X1 n=1 Tax=Drosophila sechellia TaxID=7238 RepID=UPI0013DE57B1|nr:acylphosphatase-2 isoform X1 [Drosophila sechellia]
MLLGILVLNLRRFAENQASDRGGKIASSLNLTKDTRDRCTKAGITGWVKNSKQGTIVGKMQGPKEEVDKMITWLSTEGSPGCQIDRCEVRNQGNLSRLDYKDFAIRF